MGPAVGAFAAFMREAARGEAKLNRVDLEDCRAVRWRKAGLSCFGIRVGQESGTHFRVGVKPGEKAFQRRLAHLDNALSCS